MLYLLVTGCQWRLLPPHFPHWRMVYGYFRAWQNDGTWARLHDTLRVWARRQLGRHKHPTAASLDSQSVSMRAGVGERGFDGAKKKTGRKRHLLVDTQGFVLALCVTSAKVSDTAGAVRVLSQVQRGCGGAKKLRLIWCDGGYFQGAKDAATKARLELRVVEKPKEQKGFALLPKRWVVERTFAWLSRCRRLVKEYETSFASSQAFIHLAMIRLMINRLK